jgi:hypothetical protein
MRRFISLFAVAAWLCTAAALLVTVPAQAATSSVTVVTEHASEVNANSAALHGVIHTGGVKTEWQFQYGRSTKYSTATPVKTIAAGNKNPVPVSVTVKHLQAGTVYHFRLIAITGSTGGPTRTKGRDLTFTTKSTGRLVLDHTQLPVTKGRVAVTFTCASTITCAGRFTIRATAKLSKTHKPARILCATALYSIGAHQRKMVTTKVRPGCAALLKKNSHHRLIAKLSSGPRTGQRALIRTVILVRH